jgi:hypothetical protein
VEIGALSACDFTSTICPPWFLHWTTAANAASSVACAFALPTPASSYVLHVIAVPVTEQLGVPDWR